MNSLSVLVVAAPDQRAQLSDALAGMGFLVTIRGCARADKLAALAASEDVGAVVAELRDATGASTVPALLALRRRFENLPVIVSAVLTPVGMRDVVRAIAAGLEASWVVRDVESLPAAMMRAVVERVYIGPASVLLQALWPLLSAADTREFFAVAAIGAARPITTCDAARIIGIAVRTLEGRLERRRLPPPHRVLGWCRVLHATWYLDNLGQAPKQVADRLRFPSLSALYNLLHHYGAPRPSTLQLQGGFDEMLHLFVHELGR